MAVAPATGNPGRPGAGHPPTAPCHPPIARQRHTPYHSCNTPAKGDPCTTVIPARTPRHSRTPTPSFPRKRESTGGGAARGIPPQSRRASDPRGLTQRSPKTGIQGGGAPRGIPRRRPPPPLMTHSDVTLPTHSHTSVAQPPRESGHPARRRGAGHPPKTPFCTTSEATPTRKQPNAQSHAEATGRFPAGKQSTFFDPFSFTTPQKKCLRNHAKVNSQPDHMPTIRRAGHPSRACTAAHPSTAIHRATSA